MANRASLYEAMTLAVFTGSIVLFVHVIVPLLTG